MKRRMACILALLMFFSSSAFAEITESVFDSARIDMLNSFEESWFLGDAHLYQHDLCIASIQLAQDAFRGDDDAPDAAIRQFFESNHFSAPQINEYDVKSSDTIGSAIAHRDIGTADNPCTLVAVAVCGGNYGMEWLSNFDVGTESLHKGFSESAQKIVDRVKEYLAVHKIENPRFWITGYSRAAAVSNLTAAFLSQQGVADDSHIFCYTFATPRTVIDENAHTRHLNIFNIINYADLVPQVPFASWGYTWYGNVLYLPSSLSETLDYDELLPAFDAAYEALYGQMPAEGGDKAFADKAILCAKGMALSASNPQKYIEHYQPILNKVLTGEELLPSEQVLIITVLMNAANMALKNDGKTVSFTGEIEEALSSLSFLLPMLLQHMPQVYTAWLIAIDDTVLLGNRMPPLTK